MAGKPKKRRNVRSTKKTGSPIRFQDVWQNIAIVALVVIVSGFIWSIVNNYSSDKSLPFGIKPDLPSLLIQSDYEQETGHRLTAEVLNGCGESGLASDFADYLRHSGIDVIRTGNAYNYDYSGTLVVLRRGNEERAQAVAKILEISPENVITRLDSTLFLDVTVILGNDFESIPAYQKLHQMSNPF